MKAKLLEIKLIYISIKGVDIAWLQILSGGHYKHVTGRPIFKREEEDRISMAFLYSPQNTNNNFKTNRGRTISLGQQAISAIILTLMYHILVYVNKNL